MFEISEQFCIPNIWVVGHPDRCNRESAGVSGRGAERILRVIEWLAGRSSLSSLTEIARALDIPKSSAFDLLGTLVAQGYAARDEGGLYSLVRLPGEPSINSKRWGTIVRLADEPLRKAVEETGESGFVAVLGEGPIVLYLNKILPEREIRYDRDTTIVRRPHQVSSGLVMLASFDAETLEAYTKAEALKGRLESDPATLYRRVAEVQEAGYAANPRGVVEGAAGVSAPIFGEDSRIIAAINLAGPAGRMASQIDRVIAATCACASAVSDRLSFH